MRLTRHIMLVPVEDARGFRSGLQYAEALEPADLADMLEACVFMLRGLSGLAVGQ